MTLDGKLLTDDFYNGRPVEVGLARYAPAITNGELQVKILPLQKNAPIFMAAEARPNFGTAEKRLELQSAEIVPRWQMELKAER